MSYWKRILIVASVVLALSALGVSALAQTQETGRTVDPGVVATTLMDRGEVRILRVEIAPGGERQVHTHNDVQFHVFVPISGAVQLAIGSEKPVEVGAGKAQFFKANTPHGWKNTGNVPAVVMEFFVKTGSPQAAVTSIP